MHYSILISKTYTLNTLQYYTCMGVYSACILYTCLHLCVVYIDVLASLRMCRLYVCEHSAYLFVCAELHMLEL